jgi:glycosyltransferase involved in cell wall biosynthesis
MNAAPPLSIGLPVYNGEDYLAQSLDALLGQTYGDFELVISSNASTDGTDEICRAYAMRDARVRLIVQSENLGAVPNHNFVLDQARGRLFKWASADDLYARTLLSECVDLLESDPDAVVAHSWTAAIDPESNLIQARPNPFQTSTSDAVGRLRSLLIQSPDLAGAIMADDFYGVMRTAALRSLPPLGSYYHADYAFTAELSLRGRFLIHPEFLYFRRHHPGRTTQRSLRAWSIRLDPARHNPWLHPSPRLYAEYAWNCIAMPWRSPLSLRQRMACYRVFGAWAWDRTDSRLRGRHPSRQEPRIEVDEVGAETVRTCVSGWASRA